MKKILNVFTLTIIIFFANSMRFDTNKIISCLCANNELCAPKRIARNPITIKEQPLDDIKEEEKGPVLPDPDDTTSFFDSILLNNSFYDGVFSSRNDYDYYYYTSSFVRCVYVDIFDYSTSTNDVEIYIYKNSSTNMVASYVDSEQKTYSNFHDLLVYVEPGDTLYIKVRATSQPTPYSISVIESPSFAQISTLAIDYNYTNVSYYGGNNNIRLVYYNNIYSFNNVIPNSSTTFLSALNDASNLINSMSNGCNLVVSNTTDNNYVNIYVVLAPQDIIQNLGTGNEYGVIIAACDGKFIYSNLSNTYNYSATAIFISYDYFVSINGSSNINGVKTIMMHEILHALGLSHANNSDDIMYYFYSSNMLHLTENDIASFRAIWG